MASSGHSSQENAIKRPDVFSSSVSPPPELAIESQEISSVSSRALPDQLVQQITIYFEEGLCMSAVISNATANRTRLSSNNNPI